MNTEKATMADVAKRAGVSAATVARVLYKNGYVKKETRQAVEAAVEATGYRPNMVARGLRTSRSHTLGLVVSERLLNAFPPAVAHIIQLEALKHGYTALTLNNHMDPVMESRGVRRFLDHHVDAVIFCTAIDPANVRLIHRSGTPTVQIERLVARVGSLVGVDPNDGMRQAVDHLFNLGHRCFAYLGGDVDSSLIEGPISDAVEATRERLFAENLARHGIVAHAAYFRRCPYYIDGKPHRQPGYLMSKELLALDPRPTAIVCGSDLLAAAALQAIGDADLRVPEDISIIGFDDTLAEMLTPALSSIAQPIEELGRLAVEMAIRAIDNANRTPEMAVLPTRLTLRESTAPPRNLTALHRGRA